MSNTDDCPFCNIANSRIIAQNDLAVAVEDNFPVSPGHLLFAPHRHIASWFEATEEEQVAIFKLINQVQEELLEQGAKPSDYNIGINNGMAAGQTIMHLHVHLIPRYPGDVDDPRGGIRYVVPHKAKYWEK